MTRSKKLISNEEIIELYEGGLSSEKIAPIAGISERGVRWILNKHGVKMRGTGAPRKHKVNEDFFKSWTPEMAWVLGLMATDAHVYEGTLTLPQKDERLLQLVLKHMDATYPITYAEGSTPRIIIWSREIEKDLEALGVHRAKTLTVKFPPVPHEFLHHFIRGVIDGDGHVEPRGYTTMITSASPDFAHGLLRVFDTWSLHAYIKEDVSQKGVKLYRVRVSGKLDVAELATIVYQDAGENCMIRKREAMSQRIGDLVEYKALTKRYPKLMLNI